MGVLVRKHDGAWWVLLNLGRPVEVVEVGHPGLVAEQGRE